MVRNLTNGLGSAARRVAIFSRGLLRGHCGAPTRQVLSTILMAYGVVGAIGDAQAQNPLIISEPVSGRTVDGTLSFSGTVSVNSITRHGTIRGQTNTGVGCQGTTSVNLTFSHGVGTIACGQLTARFVFSLTSRQPTTGTGTGTLSDGRKVALRVGQ